MDLWVNLISKWSMEGALDDEIQVISIANLLFKFLSESL